MVFYLSVIAGSAQKGSGEEFWNSEKLVLFPKNMSEILHISSCGRQFPFRYTQMGCNFIFFTYLDCDIISKYIKSFPPFPALVML
jgi:hypothetical protein